MEILHNNRCSKSRCALEYLTEKGIKYAPVDLASKFSRESPIPENHVFGFHGDRNLVKRILK